MYDDDFDDAGFERESMGDCRRCGYSDFAENLHEQVIGGETWALCSACNDMIERVRSNAVSR